MKRELVPCMLIGTGVTPPGQVVSFLRFSTEVCREEFQNATDDVDLNWRSPSF